jgi:hypothetical protein
MVRDELDERTHLACEAGGQSDTPWRGLRRAWGCSRTMQTEPAKLATDD